MTCLVLDNGTPNPRISSIDALVIFFTLETLTDLVFFLASTFGVTFFSTFFGVAFLRLDRIERISEIEKPVFSVFSSLLTCEIDLLASSLNFATADDLGSLLAEEGFDFSFPEVVFDLVDLLVELTLGFAPFLAVTAFFAGVFLGEAVEVTLLITDFPLFALFFELETSGFFFEEDA